MQTSINFSTVSFVPEFEVMDIDVRAKSHAGNVGCLRTWGGRGL
jgi:hypothetical protein